jgi:hypothetical protein
LRIALGKLAYLCIQSRFGADLATGVQCALRHCSGRPGWPVASFPELAVAKPVADSCREVEVPIEPEALDGLERDASFLSVDLQQLLTHAIFVYFADLDRACPVLAAEEVPKSPR